MEALLDARLLGARLLGARDDTPLAGLEADTRYCLPRSDVSLSSSRSPVSSSMSRRRPDAVGVVDAADAVAERVRILDIVECKKSKGSYRLTTSTG